MRETSLQEAGGYFAASLFSQTQLRSKAADLDKVEKHEHDSAPGRPFMVQGGQ